MPVIALQGLRGGMGATSVTAALAWALQQLGESVLAVDFAPDNLLRLHFNTPFELPRGWARAEQDGGEWQQGAMRYCENLDFLPFGQLTAAERLNLQQHCRQHPTRWQENLAQLSASAQYNWILLDLPADNPLLAAQALPLADCVFMLIAPDANCQVRLHQQALPEGCRFLIITLLRLMSVSASTARRFLMRNGVTKASEYAGFRLSEIEVGDIYENACERVRAHIRNEFGIEAEPKLIVITHFT